VPLSPHPNGTSHGQMYITNNTYSTRTSFHLHSNPCSLFYTLEQIINHRLFDDPLPGQS